MNPIALVKVWKLSVDAALTAGGVCLAGGATLFAAHMILQNDRPRINGAEHLGVFGAPVNTPYAGALPRFDMTPIGTVASRKPETPPEPPRAETIVTTFKMRGYVQGQALVQGPAGYVTVKAGSEIPGLGRVLAIEMRAKRIAIVTESGVIYED